MPHLYLLLSCPAFIFYLVLLLSFILSYFYLRSDSSERGSALSVPELSGHRNPLRTSPKRFYIRVICPGLLAYLPQTNCESTQLSQMRPNKNRAKSIEIRSS